jgi:hypothetical protein
MRLLTLNQIARKLDISYREVKRRAEDLTPLAYVSTGGHEHALFRLDQFTGKPVSRSEASTKMIALA